LWRYLAVFAVVATIAVCVFYRWVFALRPLACLLFLIGVFAGPALEPGIAWIWNRQSLIHPPETIAGPRADSFDWLMRFESWVNPRITPNTRSCFWWDDEEAGNQMFDSAGAMYLDRRFYLADALTKPTNDALLYHLRKHATLIYIALHPEKIPALLAKLTARGFQVCNERATTLPYHRDNIRIAMYDVVAPATP
jgi:hypothetical protein